MIFFNFMIAKKATYIQYKLFFETWIVLFSWATDTGKIFSHDAEP
jgi:hypothetical protein